MSATTAREREIPPPFPPHPLPPVPEVRVQPPQVFVEPTWEYRHLTRELAAQGTLTEAELNELGGSGWELAAVLSDGSAAHFYFKRQLR